MFLVGAVLAAVHHAEVVAHRVGEPFGSLILAVAVTVIEVALIVTLMVSGEKDTSGLARDTVFAAVMISVNGIVGLSLVVGARRDQRAGRVQRRGLRLGAGHRGHPGQPDPGAAAVHDLRSGSGVLHRQLAFAAVASLLLYAMFVFTQTVQHRDFFLPVRATVRADDRPTTDRTTGTPTRPPPAWRWISAVLLVVALVSVVGLAKVESRRRSSPAWRAWASRRPLVGVVIALLVLLPEIDRGRPQRAAGTEARSA